MTMCLTRLLLLFFFNADENNAAGVRRGSIVRSIINLGEYKKKRINKKTVDLETSRDLEIGHVWRMFNPSTFSKRTACINYGG